MTIEEKIAHIQSVVMEEARGKGNAIIEQHKKALDHIFETHRQEVTRQSQTRIKGETTSARQQLNTAASKRQIQLKRELSKVKHTLKTQLFEEVRELLEEYMKTEDYKELLAAYIAKAARFADGQSFVIYINPSDADKKDYLEERTGMTVTMGKDDFVGGIRAVIPERNILMDYSFEGAMEKEYEEFIFKGGAGIE